MSCDKYPEDKTEKDLEKHVAPAIRGHMQDFLQAIASRGKPVADIEQGHISTASCILANLSHEAGPHADLGRGQAAGRRATTKPTAAAPAVPRAVGASGTGEITELPGPTHYGRPKAGKASARVAELAGRGNGLLGRHRHSDLRRRRRRADAGVANGWARTAGNALAH